MMSESQESIEILKRGLAGDQRALSDLWDQYRERLRRVVKLRMDRRMQGRVDVSDVLQEAFIDFASRAAEYVNNPTMPFYLWIRYLTGQRLQLLHRHHLGTMMRDAGQEVSIHCRAMTHTGDILGTIQYMSPERFKGQCDARADVYSLGLTLYEMLVLKPAFASADRLQLIELVLAINIVGPLMYLRLMQAFKDKEAAEILAVAQSNENQQLAKEQEQLALEKTSLAEDNERKRHAAEDSANSARLATERVEQILVDMSVERGFLSAERNRDADAILWFARAAELAGKDSPSRKDNLIRVQQYLGSVTRPVRIFTHSAEWVEELSFDATGRYLCTFSTARPENPDTKRPALPTVCILWDVDRGEPLELPDFPGMLTTASWSHHGPLVALGTSEGRVLVWNIPERRIVSTMNYAGPITDLQFSEDDQVLGIASGKTALAWNVENETEVLSPQQHPDRIVTVAISEHGKRLATIAETGKLEYQIEHGSLTRDIAFSSDGQFLATSSGGLAVSADVSNQSAVYVTNLETGERVSGPMTHPDWAFDVAFSPDGKRLLTSCRDGSVRIWDWRRRKLALPPLLHNDEVHSASFSPDGRFVVTVSDDKLLQVWSAADGKPVMTPRPIATTGLCIGWIGTSAIISGHESTIEVFDLQELSTGDSHSVVAVVQLSELVSGRRVEEGGEALLTSEEFLNRYHTSREAIPDKYKLTFGTADLTMRADEREADDLSDTLVRHWKQVPLSDARGQGDQVAGYFQNGNWPNAAHVLLSDNLQSPYHAYLLAQILVDCQLVDEYRTLCQTQLKEIRVADSSYMLATMAATFLLSPEALQDYGPIRDLLETAIKKPSGLPPEYDERLKRFVLSIRGLLALREGEFASAIELSRAAQTSGDASGLGLGQTAMLVEGLAQRGLGHADEAEELLKRAQELFASEQASIKAQNTTRRFTPAIVISRILLREAGLEAAGAETLKQRGEVHLTLGHFSLAAEFMRRSLELNPDDHELLYHRTFLLIALNNEEGLTEARRNLIEGWGMADDPMIAERTAKACLLSPFPGPDISRACELADLSSLSPPSSTIAMLG